MATVYHTPSPTDYNQFSHAQLVALVQERDQTIATLENNLQILQNRIRREKAKEEWEKAIDSRPSLQMNGTQKAMLKVLSDVIEKRTPDEDGFTRIYREDIAKPVGRSIDAASDFIGSLVNSGLAEKQIKGYRDEATGQPREVITLKVAPEVWLEPETISLPKKGRDGKVTQNTWGGVRVRACRFCLSTRLHITCMDCESHLRSNDVLDLSPAEYNEMLKMRKETQEIVEANANEQSQETVETIPMEEESEEDILARENYHRMLSSGIPGVTVPERTCFHCQTANWVPGIHPLSGNWAYMCGTCNPTLEQNCGVPDEV